jgi:hypothetical protein
MYAGRGFWLAGGKAAPAAAYAAQSCLGSLALLAALPLAYYAWPPLLLNPLKSEPVEFLVITIFQRWIWYTALSWLAGVTGGGAFAMWQRWFRR